MMTETKITTSVSNSQSANNSPTGNSQTVNNLNGSDTVAVTTVNTANTEVSANTSVQTSVTAGTQVPVSESDIPEQASETASIVTTSVNENISETASSAVTSVEIEENVSESETVIETTVSVEEIIEETAISTVTETTAVVSVPSSEDTTVNDVNYVKIGLLALLVAAGAAGMIALNKRKKTVSGDKNAKQRDEERLSAQQKNNSKSKNKKKKADKSKQNISKTAQNTLPYVRVISDNIWLIAANTYSKAYRLSDINYNIGDATQQIEILQNYSAYLNTLDNTVDCQICCWNSGINVEEFEQDILIDLTGDDFDEYRTEYNERVLKENIRKGNNSIQKHLYLTLTIKTNDEEYAIQKFRTLDTELKNSFDRVGNTHLKPMTSQERVELLKDFFVGTDVDIPTFDADDYKNKLEKVYCCPDYFEFKPNYFMFNNKYAKCVFIKDYPSKAADSIITDLIDTNLDIMVTTNIMAYDPAQARKLVQRQITAIDTNMAQRESKAAKAGNFSSQMPVKYRVQIDGYKSLYGKLTMDDQKLFFVNTIIMFTADSYEELENYENIIKSTLNRNGCMFGQMKYQQEDGMCDCLPVGSHRKFNFRRSLPTESVAIFQPFNVKEVTQRNAVFYGLNALSDNLITFNRMKSLINPSGFFLGTSGSGKSMYAKIEMTDVFLRTDADIMIIDPEREYAPIVDMCKGENVKISLGSQNFINPFDFEFSLLDDPEVNVIADKCQLIVSFISCMDTVNPLNAQEVSFIDRCVRQTYEKSNVVVTRNKDDMPKLSDFFEVVRNAEEVDTTLKNKIQITLEMYIGDGSASYFDNATNVDVNNRVISYDIKDLSDTLKTQSMLLILDYIWGRLSANRERGKATWIYIDEVYLLFADRYCLEYLRKLYKRARKYGGVLTGITQNVEDLLRDDSCRTMLSNSEWIVLLKQAPADIIRLQETLKFNDSEIQFVSNVERGRGLLVMGGKDKIPFYNEFPTDTELYKRMTTSFTEMAAMKNGTLI